jgi:microcystin-dependent protein
MDPFLGEIWMFGGNFAPQGRATCDGQILPIAQNTALFSLLGTTYGGNGQTTFALPDLRGRLPVHIGGGLTIGQAGGSETVTLTATNLPAHTHVANAASAGTTLGPAGHYWAADPGENVAPYAAAPDSKVMSGAAIGAQGGSQPHENMQPFLAVTFIMALEGIYPSRS